MRTFEQVWIDIQRTLQDRREVRTICKGFRNEIISFTQNHIVLKSERSKKGVVRKIAKSDFEYVWNKIREGEIYTLDAVHNIIGRRAITCAIIALLDYVEGVCRQGRVHLTLKKQ